MGLRKDLRCLARPKFLGDASGEPINQRDGWLSHSAAVKGHVCDPGARGSHKTAP